MFPITCLSIPGICKKKYHSLCSATALVNNPSLGATSESPARSPTWWVPCQFGVGAGGLLREERMRRGQGGDKGEEEGCIQACSCIITGVLLTAYCLSGVHVLRHFSLFLFFFHSLAIHPCFTTTITSRRVNEQSPFNMHPGDILNVLIF